MTLIPVSQPACWSAVDAGALEDQELVSGLREIVVAENALSSLKLRVLAQIDTRGLAKQLGSKTTGDWLGGTGAVNPGAAKRMVRTAVGLEALPTVAESVRAGDISVEHAAAVVTAMAAIDAVAPDLDESVRAATVETLLTVAQVHAPYLVAEKGRDLVLRFGPREGDIPAEDVSRNSLEMSRTRSGRVRLVGDLDALTGEMLAVALSPLSKPAPAADGTPDERTPAQRRADGLARLLDAYLAAGTGPTEGGVRPHVVLTVHASDLAAARAGAGSAATGTDAGTDATREGAAASGTDASGQEASAAGTDPSGQEAAAAGTDATDDAATATGTDPSGQGAAEVAGNVRTDADSDTIGTHEDGADRHADQCGTDANPSGVPEGDADRAEATDAAHADTAANPDAPAPARDATPDPARFGEPAPFRLEWMGAISTELAQMLACDCTITSIVLDDREVPLKLGRTQRLVPASLRRAVVARDVGCVRCGAPAAWSQCHHIVPWSEGGPTDLTNTALVCGGCHRELHRGYWDLMIGPDGHVWIIPPRRIDKHRKPVPGFFRRTRQQEVA